MAITDEQVVQLLPALEEAARADPETAPARFVPPRTGILEQTAAKRHLFVFGRRGAGKSTLLRRIERDAHDLGARVLFIDVETLRGRPYPDVLIELLIELLKALSSALGKDGVSVVRAIPTRWRLRRLQRTLVRLLSEPQQAQHTVKKLKKRSRAASVGLELPRLKGARGAGEASRGSAEEETAHAEYTQTKMEGLLEAAVQIREILRVASERLKGTPTIVVLDDFYHVEFDDQPDVLAYLHQIVKNLPIYLKICGVRHRIKPFVEGNPPTGLQMPHDAGDVSVDITLAQFQAVQLFLEKVLAGVAVPAQVTVDELVTEGGRERLVLGSGGVARDYLDLVAKTLRKANERQATGARPHNRITAEDVNEAATDLVGQKQDDLARDAGPDADQLRERLTDVVRFCLDRNETNVFLVEGTALHETEWGPQIEALMDLRLIHDLGNFSVPWGPYRGRRFVGFFLDLSHWTGTRSERIRQIRFWEAGHRAELRRAGLVYEPGRAETPPGGPRRAEGTPGAQIASDDPGPVNWEQPPLPFEEGDITEAATDQAPDTA